MADEAKLGNVCREEFEDNAMIIIDAKAPNAVRFGMELFGLQDGMKRILFENFRSFRGFALDPLLERLEKFVEGFSGDDLHYSPMSSSKLSRLVTLPAR